MVTYRLQHFPAVCVHCLGSLSLSKTNHSSVHGYHAELESTVDLASLRLINDEKLTLRSLNPSGHDRTLPDQICKYCFDAIVTFHKFRRRLECVRKFSAGLAQLIQGNPVDLIELYTAEGAYLVQLMKSLNVCDEAETNITLEKLIEDLPSFELIDNSQKHQYTVLDTAAAEPPLQEKTPPSSWHVPTNDITNVGVNANVNADSVTEQILPDSHVTNDPVVVLSDSDDEEQNHRNQPMEVAETNCYNNNNNNSQENQYTGSANSMVDLTQGNSSDLTPGQTAFQNTNNVEQQLSNRVFTSHPTNTFYCTMCTKKFKSSAGLEKHYTVHGNGFLCTLCGVTFQVIDLLKNHKEIVHNIQCYFYCNTCLEVFPTPERLTTHTARHKSPKPKECGQCLKSFPNKDYHRTHICISYRDDYVCCEKEWAGHVFYNQHVCKEHRVLVDARVKIPPGVLLSKLRPELGGMDFYCKFCDKRLDTRKDYHAHMESSSHMMHALVIP
uniref:C2H2-type domain-containing protein n=1 Tax=Anopheles atroparvus TaxID=41427 RepID=A0AAG5D9L3_ANOAO